jgi:4-hydroxy-3-polyprenylbenzoate decarboxylase
MPEPRKRFVVAITGASGAAYAQRLLQCLVAAGAEVHLAVSPNGRRLLAEELGIDRVVPQKLVETAPAGAIVLHSYRDVGAPIASGSFITDGMVICPCSSNTLGQVASGIGSNLIARAAAVHLKEARRLVLVTREMPVSQIDIANMLRVSQAGGIICPASPGFYMRPRTVGDIVDFVAGKVCDLLGAAHAMNTRWTGGQREDRPPDS